MKMYTINLLRGAGTQATPLCIIVGGKSEKEVCRRWMRRNGHLLRSDEWIEAVRGTHGFCHARADAANRQLLSR